MPAFKVPVVIFQLKPPFLVLEFFGRDAPEPLTVGGRQRAIQTHYAGSPRASVQHMGYRHDDIPLVGRWYAKRPINLLGGPEAKLATARSLMQSDSLCYLVWGSAIRRTGRVFSVVPRFFKDNDIAYDITFAVDSASEAAALKPLPPAVSTAAELADQAEQILTIGQDAQETANSVAKLGLTFL